jgi:hypothetical protein
MKTMLKLFAICCLPSAICCSAFAQGSLTPPGAPAPTMKTADQIEPRTPISSAPFTITNSGSYYLTANLTVSSGNAITIATNGVTLDLNGFTIASTAASASGTAISLNTSLSDITIFNGHIRSGVTNNSSGVFGGSGFGYGIYYSGNTPANVMISKVSVAGVLGEGINLGSGFATVVEACTVTTAGGNGIAASTVKGSVAIGCGGSGIYGDQVADCRGISIAAGNGIHASATALNCYGQSSSSDGIYAADTVQNSYGQSSSGNGVNASISQNCFGSSTTGTGLVCSRVANGCYGLSTSGTGLHSYSVAIGCYGFSTSGTGLSADIANSCAGSSFTVNNKYNMP